MKNELKQFLAKKCIDVLEAEAVSDVDKRKVFSCAYGLIKKKTKVITNEI